VFPNIIHLHRLNSPVSERPPVVLLRPHGDFRLFAAEKNSSQEDSLLSSNIIRIATLLPLHPREARHLERARLLFPDPLSVHETIHEIRLLQCDSVIIPLPLVLIPLALRLRHLSAKVKLKGIFPISLRLRRFSLGVYLSFFDIFPLPPLRRPLFANIRLVKPA